MLPPSPAKDRDTPLAQDARCPLPALAQASIPAGEQLEGRKDDPGRHRTTLVPVVDGRASLRDWKTGLAQALAQPQLGTPRPIPSPRCCGPGPGEGPFSPGPWEPSTRGTATDCPATTPERARMAREQGRETRDLHFLAYHKDLVFEIIPPMPQRSEPREDGVVPGRRGSPSVYASPWAASRRRRRPGPQPLRPEPCSCRLSQVKKASPILSINRHRY